MGKNAKSRAKHLPQPKPEPSVPSAPLMLGEFEVPQFDNIAAVFGARLAEYPDYASIPKVDRKFNDAVSTLFFRGGKLEDFGLKLKTGINRTAAMTAIRAWLCSFDPKHEHKEATVAWALSEWCEAV